MHFWREKTLDSNISNNPFSQFLHNRFSTNPKISNHKSSIHINNKFSKLNDKDAKEKIKYVSQMSPILHSISLCGNNIQ